MERTTTVADEDLSADAESLAAEGVDGEVVEDLRALEDSTVADAGRVLAALVVDYDDPDTTPASVRSTVLEHAGVEPDRLTATGEAVLAGEGNENSVLEGGPQGKHALLVVELGGGHVFVERLPVPGEVPQGLGGTPPSVRRAERFFEYHGGVETLPQLEGEYVDVTHEAGGWRVALPEDDDATGLPRLPAWAGATLGATVVLAVSVAALVGNGSLAGLALVTSLALAVAVGLDWLQFGAEWTTRGDRR